MNYIVCAVWTPVFQLIIQQHFSTLLHFVRIFFFKHDPNIDMGIECGTSIQTIFAVSVDSGFESHGWFLF